MDKIFTVFEEYFDSVTSLVDELHDYLEGKPVPKSLKDAFAAFYSNGGVYTDLLNSNSLHSEKGLTSAKNVTTAGCLIGYAANKFKNSDNKIKSLGEIILNESKSTQDLIENTPINYEELSSVDANVRGLNKINKQSGKDRNLNEDYEEYERRVKKLASESELKLTKLDSKADGLEEKINGEIEKIELSYKAAIKRVTEKQSQIDNILGHVSGRAIAGDYEENAADEKKVADWLRYASIGCMALIVLIVSYSFWESTTDSFDWKNSIFRIVLSFFLSIPAAYLARESAKHRERQNNHLQTALDLKAITPYIASLPEDEQHKLKTQIANRIFASERSSTELPDSNPINTQEIIMELIRKINIPAKK